MTYRVLVGDVRDRLRDLEDGSVQTCITSPPYWGLRDYGTATWDGGDAGCDHLGPPMRTNNKPTNGSATFHGGTQRANEPWPDRTCGKCGATRIDSQLGLEPTPEAYVENMVAVFREVRRVLRDDGTVWLNLGDSYAGSWGNQGRKPERGTQRPINGEMLTPVHDDRYPAKESNTGAVPPGLKPKDLVGIPWRVAFALQADGWYLRSDIIWSKPNPMPESVTDRPTKAHEYLFLLTKSARYYFDADAVREGYAQGIEAAKPWAANGGVRNVGGRTDGLTRGTAPEWEPSSAGRNIRTVWNIATEPFPGAHFATFPKKLVEPCVKAGTSEKGCCAECGAPWVRETISTPYEPEVVPVGERFVDASRGDKTRKLSGAAYNEQARRTTVGWVPGCDHSAEPVGCTVLDPFCGSGTTGLVALRHGRSFVGIELNPAYAEMARERIRNDAPLFNEEAV